jgi:hypothetical protein
MPLPQVRLVVLAGPIKLQCLIVNGLHSTTLCERAGSKLLRKKDDQSAGNNTHVLPFRDPSQ